MEELEITLELLSELIEDKNAKVIRDVFDTHNIVDLAAVVDQCDIKQIVYLFKVLKRDISGELFSYLDIKTQTLIIDTIASNEIRIILDNLHSDDVVEIMDDLPANLVKKVIHAATPEQREEINTLLSFDPSSAGYIMSTDFVELKQNDTVELAIKKIKKQGKVAETISYCYVVDDKRKLVGMIKLRDILFEDSEDSISDHMEKDIVFVRTNDDKEEAAYLASHYDLLVVPVVNDEGCLIGIITADDILDVIEEETTEDIHKMAAILPVEDSYLNTNVLEMAKSRLPWLCALMITATFTGSVLTRFEDALAIIPVLSSFVPMIMGTAGNAGSQASVMVIRGISVDGLTSKDVLSVLWKEFRVGICCGAILLIVVIARMLLLPPDVSINVALAIALSMVLSLIFAKMVGGLLPLMAELLHQDPAAMAAPLITTIVDTLSLIIYFMLCVKLLGI